MITQTDLIRSLEQRWERLKHEIVDAPASRWHGLPDPAVGRPQELIYMAVCLYGHAESRWRASPDMLHTLEAAAEGLLRCQYPSGCISLDNCNIDSPPDTAFAVHLTALAYKWIQQSGDDRLTYAGRRLELFLRRAAEGLLTGGFHTPNHRWVLCGALALLDELLGDERLKARALCWLGEGFDLTTDGEWSERSNAGYNAICDLMLYHTGCRWGHEPSLDAIRSNLTMMSRMLHPGNTIATEYSTRQDRYRLLRLNGMYNTVYRLMASLDNNEMFRGMVAVASETVYEEDPLLLYWMLEPERLALTPPAAPISNRYTILLHENRHVPLPTPADHPGIQRPEPFGAGVLRHRSGKLSVTLMAGQQEFLYVQYGEARMTAAKLALGWFGIGSVAFSAIRQTGESDYELIVELEGGYGDVLSPERTGQSDQSGRNGQSGQDDQDRQDCQDCQDCQDRQSGSAGFVPYSARSMASSLRLPILIRLSITERELALTIEAEAVPHLFAQLLFAFDRRGELSGEGLSEVDGQWAQLREGRAVYTSGADWIAVSPGACEHRFETMRNDKRVEDAITVAIHCMTPLNRTFTITWGEAESRQGTDRAEQR